MFTVLKLLKPFFLPPVLVLLGMAAALVLAARKKWKWTVRILAAVLLGYYLLSIEPVAYLLVRSLESSVPAAAAGVGEPVAILVLAGGYKREGGARPFAELAGPSWRRLWRGIEIYRERSGGIPILYAGGSGDPFNAAPGQAQLARDYALSAGVPPEDFWIEESSRDTFENARDARSVLERKFVGTGPLRVILVTSSTHMLRSVLVLKKAGFDPIPAPADYPIGRVPCSPLSFYPSPEIFLVSTRCVHEWLGITAYRLMGRL
ncbi:MAG: YdcF family protein [Candidatus Erginobacter occultus]|nr:YdcF family protein [Candidatus Erginobacter occultus]